jgi:hypothetical protein
LGNHRGRHACCTDWSRRRSRPPIARPPRSAVPGSGLDHLLPVARLLRTAVLRQKARHPTLQRVAFLAAVPPGMNRELGGYWHPSLSGPRRSVGCVVGRRRVPALRTSFHVKQTKRVSAVDCRCWALPSPLHPCIRAAEPAPRSDDPFEMAQIVVSYAATLDGPAQAVSDGDEVNSSVPGGAPGSRVRHQTSAFDSPSSMVSRETEKSRRQIVRRQETIPKPTEPRTATQRAYGVVLREATSEE